MHYENSAEFAQRLDDSDSLKRFRQRFIFPRYKGSDAIYFTGNSLGLQPVAAREYLLRELEDWAELGVEGHFRARTPWYSYHEVFSEPLARLVGARPEEVVAMNGLTSNLHLLMASFYRPDRKRYRILCEKGAFPSDQYALESQVAFHGYDPADAIIEIAPDNGVHVIREENIIEAIRQAGNSLALVMIGGVNYYTGQLFDMEAIARAAHEAGAMAGFDLAHAAGNVTLRLHDWDVDFACWCSYKYLNSGPGSVGGAFVHERHCRNEALQRFAGWWGHDKSRRFLMEKGFRPMRTAEGWQLSNAPVFSMAVHRASLELFDEAGMETLAEKSRELTRYLEFIIGEVSQKLQGKGRSLEIITPPAPEQRGCQLSVVAHGMGKGLHARICSEGVFIDWREPNVIRAAPVPLYNSFEDVYRFGQVLDKALMEG